MNSANEPTCILPSKTPFGEICEQHVDNVITYWSQWQIAMGQPMYSKNTLLVIEEKLRENIAGMMSNALDSWNYIACLLDNARPETIFAAAQIAFRSYKTRRIRQVMEATEVSEGLEVGFTSALAWLPNDIVHPWLRRFLKSKDLTHKSIALKACRLRGATPHKYLNRFLKEKAYTKHRKLYSESLRIVGELKVRTEKESLYKALKYSGAIRFWALQSLVLLGDHRMARQLAPYIFECNQFQFKAIDIVFRVVPSGEAWELINELRSQKHLQRCAIKAAACLGDPAAIPWLLEWMRDPPLARVCGEAFYTITGIHLNKFCLSMDPPYTDEELTEMDPSVELSHLREDEHLPWPDTENIWVHWHNNSRPVLHQGERYLLGERIQADNLPWVIENGKQRQRRAAALELALMIEDYYLFSTRGVFKLER